MSVVIYHNPRCSKSRQTLQLLQEQGQQINVIEYLKEPPSKSTMEQLLKMLGVEPRDLMRRKESLYQELNLDDDSLSRAQLIKAMVEHPSLIERPIVVNGNKAAIGRPPENVLSIL